MSAPNVVSGDVAVVVLPSALTIAVLADLKSQIDASVAEGQGIVLDLGSLERIDSAGVQFLLALLRGFPSRLRAVGDSPALRAMATLYQLDGALAPLCATRECDHA